MTGAFCLIRLGRSTKKYLRTNIPWRPRIEPPQLKHLTSRSGVGWGGTSMRTISYFAPQFGQSNGTDCESDIRDPPNRRSHRLSKKRPPNTRADSRLNDIRKFRLGQRSLKTELQKQGADCSKLWHVRHNIGGALSHGHVACPQPASRVCATRLR